jgi:N6-L-threonylcarbamoyladenine synthase
MRGEVYPALYRTGGGAVARLSAERVADPSTVAAEWAELGEPITITGNALAKYADIFHHAGQIAPESLWPVTGEGVLAAYVRAAANGAPGDGDPGSLLPIYTRLSDAEENERIRTDGGLPDCGVVGPGSAER